MPIMTTLLELKKSFDALKGKTIISVETFGMNGNQKAPPEHIKLVLDDGTSMEITPEHNPNGSWLGVEFKNHA